MTHNIDEPSLNREQQKLSAVTAFVYLAGGLLFIIALGLIMSLSSGPSFTGGSWFLFALWIAALCAFGYCADRGFWVFGLLDQWDQSIQRRRRALEHLAAHRAGETILHVGPDGIGYPVEERDGILVSKHAPVKTVEAETIEQAILVCKKCGQKNRLHRRTQSGFHRCGSCRSLLADPFPI